MQLTGPQAKQLRDALLTCYNDRTSLMATLSSYVKENASVYIGHGSMQVNVFETIRLAENHGKVSELYWGARAEFPKNPALLAIDFIPRPAGLNLAGETLLVCDDTTRDLNRADWERPVHARHLEGLTLLISDITKSTNSEALTFLKRLYGAEFSYSQLPVVSDRAVMRSIDRTFGDDNTIPDSSIDEICNGVKLCTPNAKVCDKCKRLNVKRVAARWLVIAKDRCPLDGGIFQGVTFEARIRAWTTRQEFSPGTRTDDDGLPITSESIQEWLNGHGKILHYWWNPETQNLDLAKLCEYILWNSRMIPDPSAPSAPVEVLGLLSNPSARFFDQTAVRILVEKSGAKR